MQNFFNIPPETFLQDSILPLMENFFTIMSNHSGTTFPTVNTYVGMLCMRTDENKLYQLIADTVEPVWYMLIDFTKTPTNKEYVDALNSYVDTALNLKAPINNPSFTGNVIVPTLAAGDSSTKAINSAWAQAELAFKAPKESPTFTGTVSVPTPDATDNTAKAVNSAWVKAQGYQVASEVAGLINSAIQTTGKNSQGAKTVEPITAGVPSNAVGADGDIRYQY